jgi:hypothetical protein
MSNPARQLMNLPPVTMHMVLGGQVIMSVSIEEVLGAVTDFALACADAAIVEECGTGDCAAIEQYDAAAWAARATMLAKFGVFEPERQGNEQS